MHSFNFIRFNNENVYTLPAYTINESDLARSRSELGTILTGYFFVNEEDRYKKSRFNRDAINAHQGGLLLRVRAHSAKQFRLPIYGLENITRFLIDMNALGQDISFLKEKHVTAYMHGEPLIGIGVKTKE